MDDLIWVVNTGLEYPWFLSMGLEYPLHPLLSSGL